MSSAVLGLKRVAVRIPPGESCSHCGQAVSGQEGRRFGFLLSEGDELVRVRFLNPMGFSDTEIPKDQLLGVVGETFVSSPLRRPEVCERVAFDIHWRWKKQEEEMGWVQRKGWVEEVLDGGLVRLAVGHGTKDCWVEELALLPLGEGYRDLTDEEVEALVAQNRSDKGGGCAREKTRETKGGGGEEKEKTDLLKRAERGAEELRALLAELADNNT